MTRDKIIEALSKPRSPSDIEIIGAVARYLQTVYDPEIYALVEKSFGMSFANLQHAVFGSDESDFQKAYRGTCVWLKTYLELTAYNEAPGIFHALSALAVASVLIGRRVWIPMGFYDIYPPIGVILVGPSGARKTVAISIASKLLEASNDVNVIRERFTPEALVLALNPKPAKNKSLVRIENRTAFVISPEMAVTFGKSRYLEGLVPLFTRLMDHEGYEGRTKGGGTFKLTNVALGFLGATTLEWMLSEMNESVVSGGFTSRFLIAHTRSTPRVIWRHNSTPSDKLSILAEEISSIASKASGPIEIEPATNAFMEQWYSAHRLMGERKLGAGYHSRKHVHILRLALLFAVLQRSTQITMEHVLDALSILEYLEPGMEELFRLLSTSQTARDASAVVEILYRSGGRVSRTILINAAIQHMTIGRFHEAYGYLRETNVVYEDRGRVCLSAKSQEWREHER